ncbi:MAG: DUF2617 family protein [Stackebrandtia sp.]
MIVDLDIPFEDTCVCDLRYLPGAPDIPVLGSMEFPDIVPGASLSLRLLGASHQAVLTLPEGHYAETVACVPDSGGPLPKRSTVSVGSWQCRFDHRVDVLSAADLAVECAWLRERAARLDPTWTLVGTFPGSPDALTYLHVDRFETGEALGWSTVHVYPESGQMVHTSTRLLRSASLEGS